jgi:hypothetical protein
VFRAKSEGDKAVRAAHGDRVRRLLTLGGLFAVGLGVLTGLAIEAPAATGSRQFQPLADAYVSSASPDSNYGSSSTLQLDTAPTVNAYLRFFVDLPAGATVTGATLRVYTSTYRSSGFSVHAIADDAWWGERSITYANAPQIGARLGGFGSWSDRGYKTVALPAGSIERGMNSFALVGSSDSLVYFRSREGEYKPTLTVNYSQPASGGAVAQPARGPQLPAAGAYFGAFVDGDAANSQTREEVTDFESMIGRTLRVGHKFRVWASTFQLRYGEEGWHVASGRIPMISHGDAGYSSPSGVKLLDAINDGSQDELIRAQAGRVRDFGHPLFYRLFWEMNGRWNAYNEESASTPGTHDGSEKFVAAWRRIHRIYGEEGATNAAFVWCPTSKDSPATTYNRWARYYPGDRYVDWVCADGYNRGTDETYSRWTSFSALFSSVYSGYPHKPFMVGETSSSENGGDKALWIRNAQSHLKSSMTRTKAFLWFHRGLAATDPTSDWRVDTSPQSLEAYRAMGADPYFGP